jgi:transcriptional regulator with XRE-family HTH domain
VELDLGSKLRFAREAKNLSLRSVASAVGVSASLLSQVETGKTQPSVSTLYSIVTHLGLSLDELMGHEPIITQAIDVASVEAVVSDSDAVSDSVVQRHQDNPAIDMENGVTWERLAVGNHEWVSPIMVTYAPGGSSSVEGKLMRHEAIEFGVITEGTLTLKLEFKTYTIRAGDSFCFDANRPHMYINETDKDTKGVWFVVSTRDEEYTGVDISTTLARGNGGKISSAVDVLNAMKIRD